jgi:hypothetical protein
MKVLLLIISIVSCNVLFAQQAPVKWSFELKSTNAGKAEFTAKAIINKGWNIYSVYMEEGGPVPTVFTFDQVVKGSLEGKIIEKSEKITAYDDLFEMDVIKFKNTAEFSQALVYADKELRLMGNVLFMCCDSQRCLPPVKVPFDLKL